MKHLRPRIAQPFLQVASLAEAWIETPTPRQEPGATWVASLAEAWIETEDIPSQINMVLMSPPSRRRGLKRSNIVMCQSLPRVASLAEAWIETVYTEQPGMRFWVASLAEAWIETLVVHRINAE